MDADIQTTDRWRVLFDTALAEKGPVGVARDLGYNNHTLVSRIVGGHVSPSTKFQARVLATYNVVRCPHSGRDQQRALCRTWVGIAAPTHNPASLAAWRACQRCPNKPGGAA